MQMSRRHLAVGVLLAASLTSACHPNAERRDQKKFARQILRQVEGSSQRISLINLVVSPDRTVFCGMARIGPVRTTPYWIKLSRPYPDTAGATHVRLAPSIDAAKDKSAARTAVMQALSEIPERCAAAGAPLPSYL